MDTEHWHRVKALFEEAVILAPEQRAALLDEACRGDARLRADVEALLSADTDVPTILEASLDGLAAFIIPDRQPAQAGQQVGSYRILRELGRGGMGMVYLAEREDLQKKAALKLVRDPLASPERIQRFHFEQRVLARLEHPNIARLLDAGVTDQGTPYFVMEYVGGIPLDAYCDAQSLTVEARLNLFGDVCRAVQYAHRNLVVHRDLKPSNILVTDAGEVKLLDFGIAKLLEEDGQEAPLTRSGMQVMTPAYAAPEQVLGEAITTATDVYALGLIMYELLTGHPPYQLPDSGLAEIARVICEARPEKPSTVVGKVETIQQTNGTTEQITPERVSQARSTQTPRLRRRLRGDLDNILLMALRKEPERRYPSAELFLEDIKRHLAGLPVNARRDTLPYRTRKFIQRHRMGVSAILAIFLLLLAYAVTVTRQSQQIAQERNRAQIEAERATRVSAFLEDMYRVGDPFGPDAVRIDTMRVYAFLKEQGQHVLELTDQPSVQADLMDVVGRMYLSMGLLDEARAMLEPSIALKKSLYGAAHAEVAYSLNNLGQLLFRRGDLEEAEALFRESLAQYQVLFEEDHHEVASAKNNLGDMLRKRGALDEAEVLLRESLAVRRRMGGRPLAQTLNNLALVRRGQGAYEEAAAFLGEALSLNREHVGETHPAVAVVLGNLGLVLQDQGDLVQAARVTREALILKQAQLGIGHWRTGNTMFNLARMLHNQGHLAEAEALTREVVSIYETTFSAQNERVFDTLLGLADVRLDQGAYEDAERLYRQVLRHYHEHGKATHPVVASAQIRLGGLLVDEGRIAEADRLLEAGLTLRQAHYQADDWRIAEARSTRAALLVARGRFAQAEPLLLNSHATLAQRWSPMHAIMRRSHKRIAALYDAWEEPEKTAAYQAWLTKNKAANPL